MARSYPSLSGLPPELLPRREALADAARRGAVRVATHGPLRPVVQGSVPVGVLRERLVARDLEDAIEVGRSLARTRRVTALAPLLPAAEDDLAATTRAYREALSALAASGLPTPEIHLDPAHLGLGQDQAAATTAAREIAAAALADGIGVTLSATPQETVLDLADAVREVHPEVTVTVVTRRHRAEAEVARLLASGGAIRLIRGGTIEQPSIAWQDHHEADLSYVRCLTAALTGRARVTIATAEPTLLDLAAAVDHQGAAQVQYELHRGIQADLQVRTADAGHRLLVVVPYGPTWFEHLTALVERPASTRRLLAALLRRS